MRDPNIPPFFQWFKDYLTFHSIEKNRILTLLVLILLLSVIQLYFILRAPKRNMASIEILGPEHFKTLELQEAEADRKISSKWKKKPSFEYKADLKPFDPNELDSSGWRKLGLSPRQAKVMIEIRNQRGGFKSKCELSKIRILNSRFEEISAFITLPDTAPRKQWKETFDYQNRKHDQDSTLSSFSKDNWPKHDYPKLSIELNTADSIDLVQLYGIGPSFARRIIKYRKSLGGFISKEQLQEVWGMDSTRYSGISESITVNIDSLKIIDLNKATLDELKSHPYIRYNLGRAIINYRKQHGNFQKVSDIRSIHLVTEEVYRKIAPYLTAE